MSDGSNDSTEYLRSFLQSRLLSFVRFFGLGAPFLWTLAFSVAFAMQGTLAWEHVWISVANSLMLCLGLSLAIAYSWLGWTVRRSPRSNPKELWDTRGVLPIVLIGLVCVVLGLATPYLTRLNGGEFFWSWTLDRTLDGMPGG